MDRRILLLFLCTVCQTVFSRPEDWKGKILPSHVYAAKTLLRNVQTVVPKVEILKEYIEEGLDQLPVSERQDFEERIDDLEQNMFEIVDSLNPYLPFEENQEKLPEDLVYEMRDLLQTSKTALSRLRAEFTTRKALARLARYRKEQESSNFKWLPRGHSSVKSYGLRSNSGWAKPGRRSWGRGKRSLDGNEDEEEDDGGEYDDDDIESEIDELEEDDFEEE